MYQQYLWKSHRLIYLQHQPLFLLNVEIVSIWSYLLCLGEPPVRFLWCWCFCCCIFILLLYLHLSMFFILLLFIHIFFSTSSLTLLLTIAGVFTQHFILYFRPSPPQSDSRHFHFSTIPSSRERYGLDWHVLPTGLFYFTLLHRHFNLHLSRFP